MKRTSKGVAGKPKGVGKSAKAAKTTNAKSTGKSSPKQGAAARKGPAKQPGASVRKPTTAKPAKKAAARKTVSKTVTRRAPAQKAPAKKARARGAAPRQRPAARRPAKGAGSKGRRPALRLVRGGGKPAPEVLIRVRELDPFQKCGAATSVERLIRVDEIVGKALTAHLVFLDHHGWYCEHGQGCPAVAHARKHVRQHARSPYDRNGTHNGRMRA